MFFADIYLSDVFFSWSVIWCFGGGKFLVGKKEKESDISAMYLQNILTYLTPNFVCNSAPQILHINLYS